MSDLRPIEPDKYAARLGATPADVKAAKRPALKWLSVAELVIDGSYQRAIGEAGQKTLRKIAAAFDWCKFAPVIVAVARGGRGKYAIIDGQHRVTAAALCGIKEVPCQVVDADYEKQASAFADINSLITPMSPMQLHAARVAGRDPQALLLDAVCKGAGVKIIRYPKKLETMTIGETMAAGQLRNYLGRYGKDTLGLALRCITKTGNGNAGFVQAPLINALCSVFTAEPGFAANEKKLLAAMGKFDIPKHLSKARKEAAMSRAGFTNTLVDMVADHLDKAIGVAT